MSNPTNEDVRATERVAPYLRSIALEIEERTQAIRGLEAQTDALARKRRSNLGEIGRLEAELSVQRRELRMATEELKRLGWTVAETLPACFLHCDAEGDADLAYQLVRTGFHRRDESQAA
jgi:hypothetical protein